MVIDLDNSLSRHFTIDVTKQYGIDMTRVLENVLVNRQFQIYQLTHAIIYDLPKRIQLYKPKVVVVSGLLDQFYHDPYIRTAERES